MSSTVDTDFLNRRVEVGGFPTQRAGGPRRARPLSGWDQLTVKVKVYGSCMATESPSLSLARLVTVTW